MAVKLVPKFNREQITKAINEKRQRIEDAMILRLQRVGEQFVTNARNLASFTDRTGNLRSSMGYVVLKNGVQLHANFDKVNDKGPKGIDTARDVMEDAIREFPTGLVLIGVAGMEYAAAVESKGFDVISNSAGIAEEALKLALQKLAKKLV